MGRNKGLAAFSANFEPQIAAPLDARLTCPTKAELILSATWTANDGHIYAYQGMIVAVSEDSTTSNNGIYYLSALPYTNIDNWIKSSSGDIPNITATAPIAYNNGNISANIDTTPTTSSTNLVSSGGVKSYVDTGLASKANSVDLATVATTGNYTDLNNKPTIPTKVSELTNDSDFQTGTQVTTTVTNATANKLEATNIKAGNNVTVSTSGNDVTINATATPCTLPQATSTTLGGIKANTATSADTQAVNINTTNGMLYTAANPTKVSELTNDSNYQTDTQVTSAINSATSDKLTTSNIKAGTNVTVATSGNDVTINATASQYTLPQATGATLGGIKANTATSADTQAVNIDTTTGMLYTVPNPTKVSELTNDSNFQTGTQVTSAINSATSDKLTSSNIKAGANVTVATSGNDVTINATATPYTLPQATSTTLGGIKANAITSSDTQAVNIDTSTGMLYTAANPTKVSELTNDSNYQTGTQVTATVANAVSNRLTASNIKAGNNITVSTSGNDVTINSDSGNSTSEGPMALYGNIDSSGNPDLYSLNYTTNNVTVVGSPTISGNTVTNFTNSNYVKVNKYIPFNTGTWEVNIKVTSPSTLSSSSGPVSIFKSNSLNINFDSLSYISWSVYSRGGTYLFTRPGKYTLAPSTTYFIKAQFTGTVYNLLISTDENSYTTIDSYTSSTPTYSSTSDSLPSFGNVLGTSPAVALADGIIDLTSTYILVNNAAVWTGANTVLTTKTLSSSYTPLKCLWSDGTNSTINTTLTLSSPPTVTGTYPLYISSSALTTSAKPFALLKAIPSDNSTYDHIYLYGSKAQELYNVNVASLVYFNSAWVQSNYISCGSIYVNNAGVVSSFTNALCYNSNGFNINRCNLTSVISAGAGIVKSTALNGVTLSSANYISPGTVYNVKSDGTGDFATLNDAVNSLSGMFCSGTVTINLGAGTHNLSSTTAVPPNSISNLIITGAGQSSTILNYTNDTARGITNLVDQTRTTIEISNLQIVSTNKAYAIYKTKGYIFINNVTFSNQTICVLVEKYGQCVVQGTITASNITEVFHAGQMGFLETTYANTVCNITNCTNFMANYGGTIYTDNITRNFTSVTNKFNATPNTVTQNGIIYSTWS